MEDVQPVKKNCMDYGFQVYCGVAVSFIGMTLGSFVGWSSIIPRLQEDPDLPYEITTEDVKWLGANIYLGAGIGAAFGGLLIRRVGFKKVLMISYAACILQFFALTYQQNKIFLHILKLCNGIMNGFASTSMTIYVAELCEPRIRGFITSIPEIFVSIGILLSYTFSAFLHWKKATLLLILPPLIGLVSGIVVPESPYWLMRNKFEDKSKAALVRLMGNHRQKDADSLALQIKNDENASTNPKMSEQIILLKKEENWKLILLIVSLFILREVGGQGVIFNFTVYIFKSSGAPLDEFQCTVLVGSMRLLFGIISCFIVDHVGRRPLFLVSSTIYLIAMVFVTICLFCMEDSEMRNWITLGSVLTVVFAYGIGVGPVPWILTGELIPLSIRPLGSTIIITSFEAASFICLYIFPMIESYGIEYSFSLFSVGTLLLMLVFWKWVPETKNIPLIELQKTFLKNKQGDQLVKESKLGIENKNFKDVENNGSPDQTAIQVETKCTKF